MRKSKSDHTGTLPFGWIEISGKDLQRLQRELEEKGQGVVDEMGVLAIHSGYADYFFPGTSVLHTRPRYVFFVAWNILWLATRQGIGPANFDKRKDQAELWVTSKLLDTAAALQSGAIHDLDMEGIIGERVFRTQNRPPVQRIDFIYWTALRAWGIYLSDRAQDRAQLRQWFGRAPVVRSGEGSDRSEDEAIPVETLAEFRVPDVPANWQDKLAPGLDFELTSKEATWLQERLMSLKEVTEGPCLLAKAAELCGESPPLISEKHPRPWNDPLVNEAARLSGQTDRLTRARQASRLAHYVRAIYGSLVEWLVETTSAAKLKSPSRHYRDSLERLAQSELLRNDALALSLDDLVLDVPRLRKDLRAVLAHVQEGLQRVAQKQTVESVFINEATHELFLRVERRRKGARARLAPTDNGAARRAGYDSKTVSIYDLDYRWGKIRTLLWDLHQGLNRP